MSLIAGAISLCSLAQNVDRVGISGVAIEKTDNGVLIVSMQVNPSQTSVKYNQQLVITPVITSQDNSKSVSLPSVTIAGKNAYYNTLRNDNIQGTSLLRAGKKKVYPVRTL